MAELSEGEAVSRFLAVCHSKKLPFEKKGLKRRELETHN